MLWGTAGWISKLWLVSLALGPLVGAATPENVTTTRSPIVDVGYAQYQGFFNGRQNVTYFLGVRYAAPPTGSQRLQAPQAPAVESGVQLADQNPNMCYQSSGGTNTTTGTVSSYGYDKRQISTPAESEDCLFLNVFVPGNTSAESVSGLPVLVWIHGGGYASGYAAEFNGADLVIDSLNTVIAVVIQYRLGVFGFLSGSEVKAQGALNAGLLDQAFALQWVQDHIGLFGGDKDHVTIWGESAGAGSVLQHIVAHGGNTQPPLFNAAITSSVYLPPQYNYSDRVPQTLYDQVASVAGCGSSVDSFTCLQSVSAETFQAANVEVATSAFYDIYIFAPVIDGTFIVERPTETLSKGQVNGQVLLAVHNQHEGATFVYANQTITTAEYISILFPDMSATEAQNAAEIYTGFGTLVEQAMMAYGDSIIICPTYYVLAAFAGRSWKGFFAIPPAYHGEDLLYYFHYVYVPPSFNNTQFINAFSQSFLSVARSYDVNAKIDPNNITPEWDIYDVGDTEMLFNETAAGEPLVAPIETDSELLLRCAFWSTVTASTWQ